MLQHRALSWRSVRFASQLSQGQASQTVTTKTLLSRMSDRTRHTAQKSPVASGQHKGPPSSATSFVSRRSARQRDNAAKKWFTGVRTLDITQVHDVQLPSSKKPKEYVPKKHQLRPKTDLNALFSPSALPSATSLHLQTKKELGGDYAAYLPEGYADPHRLPIDYARLVLGRNKHIPLPAQTGALNVIKEAICGRTRQDSTV